MPRHETSSFSISRPQDPAAAQGGLLAIIFGEISSCPARSFALRGRAIPDAETYGKPPTLRNLASLAQPAAPRNGGILRFGASIAPSLALEEHCCCSLAVPPVVDSQPGVLACLSAAFACSPSELIPFNIRSRFSAAWPPAKISISRWPTALCAAPKRPTIRNSA